MLYLGQPERLTQTGSDNSPKRLLFDMLDGEGNIAMADMIYMDDLGAKSAQDHFFLGYNRVLICFGSHHFCDKS
jgi:hypothetical protein